MIFSVCAGLRTNGVPGTPFLCKSGVLMMGFNSLYVNTFSTCGTLMRPWDTALLKKWGPFTLGCVKRHENAVQLEHCLIYILTGISIPNLL